MDKTRTRCLKQQRVRVLYKLRSHAGILRFPVVNRRIADPVLAAELLDRHACLCFFQDPDNLFRAVTLGFQLHGLLPPNRCLHSRLSAVVHSLIGKHLFLLHKRPGDHEQLDGKL